MLDDGAVDGELVRRLIRGRCGRLSYECLQNFVDDARIPCLSGGVVVRRGGRKCSVTCLVDGDSAQIWSRGGEGRSIHLGGNLLEPVVWNRLDETG